jgi:transposase-like protein
MAVPMMIAASTAVPAATIQRCRVPMVVTLTHVKLV